MLTPSEVTTVLSVMVIRLVEKSFDSAWLSEKNIPELNDALRTPHFI
jgi:hypothetical protein